MMHNKFWSQWVPVNASSADWFSIFLRGRCDQFHIHKLQVVYVVFSRSSPLVEWLKGKPLDLPWLLYLSRWCITLTMMWSCRGRQTSPFDSKRDWPQKWNFASYSTSEFVLLNAFLQQNFIAQGVLLLCPTSLKHCFQCWGLYWDIMLLIFALFLPLMSLYCSPLQSFRRYICSAAFDYRDDLQWGNLYVVKPDSMTWPYSIRDTVC